MRAQTLFATVSALLDVNRPVLIEGSPGLGKTQIVGQIAKSRNMQFVHLHAPTLQPEDLGLPAIVGAERDQHKFTSPHWFARDNDPAAPDTGLILIDELPQGDNSIQKTLANMIQEREIHGHKLKKGWSIVATGNRQQDRAGANRILSHLRARVTTLQFEAHLDDWCDWALHNGVDPTVISFLRFKPALLNQFDGKLEIAATPRGWVEGVSAVIDKVPAEAEFECFAGAVGEGAASEFVGFLKIARKLPNPDYVLMHPTTSEVPKEASVLYAMAGAIAHRASETNMDRVLTYAERMPPEFSVLVVRDATARDKELVHTAAFKKWCAGAGSKIML